jgi:hypothetical protein
MDARRLALEEIAYQAHHAGEWAWLFEQIEQGRFLIKQAECFSGFARSSRDLEQHAMTGAAQLGDWERFAHYALLAANLRGTAEALDDEEILHALAQQGKRELAESIASQLPDAGRRAVARAVLAACAGGAVRQELTRQVRDDLGSLARPEDARGAARTFAALLAVARHLGADLAADWPGLAERLLDDSAQRSRLWLAVAESCRASDASAPESCRLALGRIEDRALLAEALHGWFRRAGSVQEAAELCQGLPGAGPVLGWSLRLTVLGRQAAADPGLAWQDWRREREAGGRLPWSIELVEAAAGFLAALDDERAAALALEIQDESPRAALEVVRLEKRSEQGRAERALAALRAVADATDQLHWGLRALLAWPAGDGKRRKHLTAAAIEHVQERHHAVPAADLCRFLDLVAAVFPARLAREVAGAVHAPGSTAETLLALARDARSDLLRQVLFEQAEPFAAAVAATPAAGFELRAEVLTRLAVAICAAGNDLEALGQAAQRLLPEEEDALRAAAATSLAATHPGLAHEACAGIRFPRLKLVTRLAVAARAQAASAVLERLDATVLYEAVATVDQSEDERLALAVLAEPPLDLRDLIERSLRPMRSKERQVQALVELAHHALAFEESFYRGGQRDPLGPLQLIRQTLSGVGSDERLLELAAELLTLVEPLPVSRVLPELRETIDRVFLDLPAVPWPRRRAAIERLVLRIRPVLLGRLDALGPRAAAARCRGAVRLLAEIVELPARAAAGAARDELRRHWHEVLPVVLAAGERWRLPAPWQDRLEGFWAQCRERLPAAWSWLSERQGALVRLGLESAGRLGERAATWQGSPVPPPGDEVEALAYRLSRTAPEAAARLAGSLPPGRRRDDLAARLIGNGWLPPPESSQLEAAIGDRSVRLTARLSREDLPLAEWARLLGELVIRGDLDPADPRAWPTLRRLRRMADEGTLAALAETTAQALAGGRETGERVFRLWLNAYLAPHRERPLAGARARSEQVRAAIGRALHLDAADLKYAWRAPASPARGPL